MSVFEARDFDHHESVSFFDDKASGLKAIIAIHSTALGPACGGVRMYPYANGDAALTDALRLSRGMSYKSAIADLPLGGGKAVILGDPAKDKTEPKLLAFAEAVNALGGRYVTAMDVGIVPKDMPVIARGTKHVAGYDQPGKSGGDSGPLTALGVFVGLKAAVKHRLGVDTTKGLTIAIQGLGKVGMDLSRRLHAEGAKLVVADVDQAATKRAADELKAKVVSPDEIVTAECDVLSPNALGAILNDQTIPKLYARVVAGGANNQLATLAHGDALRARNILYAPDYVINGGGIIRVAGQIFDWKDADIEARVLKIADTLSEIFHRGDSEGVSTAIVADRMAEERMAKGRAKLRAAE
ncbi:MAG TPA: Glu/Leu/Phe/Val dehydrogenase dimerization domain-containing protein [Rhizomicrobium sp.]|nr:Glu/Leu/Phe/Val dehydrogenase dimerization domain-containing protein [Rhizomicrobium sp.]